MTGETLATGIRPKPRGRDSGRGPTPETGETTGVGSVDAGGITAAVDSPRWKELGRESEPEFVLVATVVNLSNPHPRGEGLRQAVGGSGDSGETGDAVAAVARTLT